jgi:hypothetical protein
MFCAHSAPPELTTSAVIHNSFVKGLFMGNLLGIKDVN